jgi:hypothetical protein
MFLLAIIAIVLFALCTSTNIDAEANLINTINRFFRTMKVTAFVLMGAMAGLIMWVIWMVLWIVQIPLAMIGVGAAIGYAATRKTKK